jgi:hypothetical protein
MPISQFLSGIIHKKSAQETGALSLNEIAYI